MIALVIVAVASLLYALHALSRGEPAAIVIFAFCTAVYVAVFAANRLGQRGDP